MFICHTCNILAYDVNLQMHTKEFGCKISQLIYSGNIKGDNPFKEFFGEQTVINLNNKTTVELMKIKKALNTYTQLYEDR